MGKRTAAHPNGAATSPTIGPLAVLVLVASASLQASCGSKSESTPAQRCEKGDNGACATFADQLLHGDGIEKDELRAAEVFLRACDKGMGEACGGLGWMYGTGVGVAKDDARAARLLQDACDKKHVNSCGLLGQLYREGRGVTANPSRASELLGLACEAGVADYCAAAADVYSTGERGAKDAVRSASLNREGCSRGSSEACVLLAQLYDTGQGVERSAAKAKELWTRSLELAGKACARNESHGCASLWAIYSSNTSGHTDPTLGLLHGGKACEMCNQPEPGRWISPAAGLACVFVGVELAARPGEWERGTGYLERGCECGVSMGCLARAEGLMSYGNLVDSTPWFQKACDLGDKEVCQAMGCLDDARLKTSRSMDGVERYCAKGDDKNEVRHGRSLVRMADGSTWERSFRNNRKDGKWTHVDKEGKPIFAHVYEDGDLREAFKFKQGELGEWSAWKNGENLDWIKYRNGRVVDRYSD